VKPSISSCAARRLRAAPPSRSAAVVVANCKLIGSLLLAAAAELAQATPSTPPPVPRAETPLVAIDARYDAARDDYEVGHFQTAFAEFAALADAGHCGAARMALQMLRLGRSLYAAEFRAPLERVQQWQRLPACATPARR
jgi:hypothetical protein